MAAVAGASTALRWRRRSTFALCTPWTRVYHSSDRGRTWTVAETPVHAGSASSGIFSLAFRDGRQGIAVGGDYQMVRGGYPNVALTSDAGRTWRIAKGPLPVGYLSAASF